MDRVTPLVFRNRGIMQRIMNSTTMLSLHRLILSILYEYWWRVEDTPSESQCTLLREIEGEFILVTGVDREPNIRKTIALYTKSNTCRREGRENAKEREVEGCLSGVPRKWHAPIGETLTVYLSRLSFLIIYVGAVSILFIFIIRLIDIIHSELENYTSNSILLSIIIGFSIQFILLKLLPS